MKPILQSLYKALIGSFLALLGFSACADKITDEEGEPGMVVMYGSPSATYKVRGVAVDSETSEPIPGLLTLMFRDGEDELTVKTGSTNDHGVFFFDHRSMPAGEWYISVQDIDGEANGLYDNLDFTVDFSDPDFPAGSVYFESGYNYVDLGDIPVREAGTDSPDPEKPEE